MKILIATLAGVNLLAISAYLIGAVGSKCSNWALLGILLLAMIGTSAIAWAAFSGRYPVSLTPAVRQSRK
jgi:hypothetical protein